MSTRHDHRGSGEAIKEEETEAMRDRRPIALFMAFGTKGDVFPVAALAAAFSCDQKQYEVSFITHSAHQGLSADFAAKNVTFIPISSPPVLAAHQHEQISDSKPNSVDSYCEHNNFSLRKRMIEEEHRRECLAAAERIFGSDINKEGDFIAINFFALEGWHLAELFQVHCIVTAPYVVPYSAPSSFEYQFKKDLPLLYQYFQEAPVGTVGWKDVLHWMWPLFMETWGSWRNNILKLSSIPFTDPVTDLPLWHIRTESPLLLYGFSQKIVECPGYWPANVYSCGFWFLPMEWQFSCEKCRLAFSNNSSIPPALVELCQRHMSLLNFLNGPSNPPIFVGLSSIGSMGFLTNPKAFLAVLQRVIEATEYRFILFTSGYEPLDASIRYLADNAMPNTSHMLEETDSTFLFNNRLFCFSGSIPYRWLFPRCAVAIHHAGSGSTAAALHAGIPQVLCPYLLDQFYWAERLCWIGVAPDPLSRQHLCPDSLDDVNINAACDALRAAIDRATSAKIRLQASHIAKKISSEDGIEEALNILREKVVSR
ncbi:Sterol 3-beta-glucosyltransferase [Rhynchospora pubera]|uniref:Sterol 3-beta-glucosyltransferase n=1 Tax=Rhynchospora pubera TaxID=906938 RepID=A0AAV8H101_9POAL|nr:Sterol 3-beta-glucosyltransferase [Rhynchospora pubera]